MSDVPVPVGVVGSPCTDVCRIDPRTEWCAGCLRTRDEIRAWRSADDDARRVVLARLDARRRMLARSGE
ncbi:MULTISPECIES: DUF1289 domain-containing protein [Burkholderia]|jgi:predicted Fe-S protein YdhL (DUF1289 family)|uniref:Conserved domain protein n=2 Tax=Burkholderia multivorans TaxID=87883 RepID=B9BVZ8_9BURK|nr:MULTISPECIES: DUF1289 domain-containing protein [Burkholderia]AOJ94139.1 hypothetical protein WK22_15105 [Burkholderia multivorans]EEE05170.1 conserved domain protein [Burkholderia multivorans CGD2]EEE12445.1 conserved domain protein [Burkholderia multivorans CGD2M]KOE25201.1 hypothetical protein AI46_15040 [Burkholderia multivorans R-20526]MBH9662550.1 DUF1289 domain-containing protein [Burkholderia multivorans]